MKKPSAGYLPSQLFVPDCLAFVNLPMPENEWCEAENGRIGLSRLNGTIWTVMSDKGTKEQSARASVNQQVVQFP
jgi:hypothetical protein